MPIKTERLMKERIASRISSVERVRVNYSYTGVRMPQHGSDGQDASGRPGGSGWSGRKSKKDGPAFENAKGELVLMGSDFSEAPVPYGGYVRQQEAHS